jgi:hypothetical protein
MQGAGLQAIAKPCGSNFRFINSDNMKYEIQIALRACLVTESLQSRKRTECSAVHDFASPFCHRHCYYLFVNNMSSPTSAQLWAGLSKQDRQRVWLDRVRGMEWTRVCSHVHCMYVLIVSLSFVGMRAEVSQAKSLPTYSFKGKGPALSEEVKEEISLNLDAYQFEG